MSWAELAAQAAECAGLRTDTLRAMRGRAPGQVAARPAYAVLGSERGWSMPSLEDALGRFVAARSDLVAEAGAVRRIG